MAMELGVDDADHGPERPEAVMPWSKRVAEIWRARYEGSFAQDVVKRLGAVDFGDRILIFGACLLLSVLPLIIILSAYASHHVEDDIATHLGLSAQGDRVVEGLFTARAETFNLSIFVALLLSFTGTVAVARSRSGCITQFHNLRNTPQPATSRHFPKSRLRTQYHRAGSWDI